MLTLRRHRHRSLRQTPLHWRRGISSVVDLILRASYSPYIPSLLLFFSSPPLPLQQQQPDCPPSNQLFILPPLYCPAVGEPPTTSNNPATWTTMPAPNQIQTMTTTTTTTTPRPMIMRTIGLLPREPIPFFQSTFFRGLPHPPPTPTRDSQGKNTVFFPLPFPVVVVCWSTSFALPYSPSPCCSPASPPLAPSPSARHAARAKLLGASPTFRILSSLCTIL
ncbi:hypothetical protein IWZ00DRAFT_504335 [Phyllosticta capitalensis]|uniref:uncharacterized protein n=1 Tax=Phyllosticta capitalensis TaxID=121624 RepID=UPI00312F3E16